MGKLAHLQQGVEGLKGKLSAADELAKSRQVDVEGIMSAQYERNAYKIQGALQKMVDDSRNSQSREFSSAVQSAVNSVLQSQTMLLTTLSKLSIDGEKAKSELSKEIGKISNRVEVESIKQQLMALGLQIDALPKEFPLPKDVDLSGLSKGIDGLKKSIENIKMPEMPKTVDVTPQLKAMEKRLKKRTTEFDVIRDPMSGLIEKIKVTEA